MEITLACDIVIAAENAVFALPEVKRGVCAMNGGLTRLVRFIGKLN
jgi:enoyl-CoA hydratase/carnithine racemase